MPANRNDITKKPIMTTAPSKQGWRLYDKKGKARVIWADTLELAIEHAEQKGWIISTIEKGD